MGKIVTYTSCQYTMSASFGYPNKSSMLALSKFFEPQLIGQNFLLWKGGVLPDRKIDVKGVVL